MTSYLARLSGALILKTEQHGELTYFMIGDTKRPCDWPAAGFAPPAPRDTSRQPWVRLELRGEPAALRGPVLVLESTGEAAAQQIAQRLLVERNGSVSERLWRLVLGAGEDDDRLERDAQIEARWLTEVPQQVFEVVRETVLKCT